MATIQYTSYKFHKPPLIDENRYNSIKGQLKNDPNFKPFPVESIFEKFKISFLMYFVGGPIAFIIGGVLVVPILEYLALFYAIILMGGLFSVIPEWISYLKFLGVRAIYYNKLMRKLKESEDYFHFRDLIL